ncbi:MAG: hypothetical protein PHP33_04905 [Bacteroidales bacterium]|nr:hypothetical protein [Bacteroidales bacterium]
MKRSNPNSKPAQNVLKRDTTLRVHRKTILFNDKEMEALQMYCKKYKISSQSKFIREAVVTTILRQLEEDHPKLF